MTLVVGFVHEEFALLFADRRAVTKGPSTLTMGKITIQASEGISLTGFNKVTLNLDKSAVVGIAGHAHAHDYLEAFSKSANYRESVSVVDAFTQRFSDPLNKLEASVAEKMEVKQQAIIPFFNSDQNKFCLAKFVANEYQIEKEALSSLPTHYILRCVGSGAAAFIQLVNLPAIAQVVNNFLPVGQGRGHGVAEVPGLVAQFNKLYEAVSCVDSGVSKEVDVWIATKSDPKFSIYK